MFVVLAAELIAGLDGDVVVELTFCGCLKVREEEVRGVVEREDWKEQVVWVNGELMVV